MALRGERALHKNPCKRWVRSVIPAKAGIQAVCLRDHIRRFPPFLNDFWRGKLVNHVVVDVTTVEGLVSELLEHPAGEGLIVGSMSHDPYLMRE